MRTLILLTTVALIASIAVAHEPEIETVEAEPHLGQCQAAAAELGKALKARLQAGMKEGGPGAALSVCHADAPAIAAAVSDSLSVEVGRTSLRTRNPDNAPDAWERVVLEDFDARRAAGEKARDLDTWFIAKDDEGRRTFRYMKAIVTAPLCLKCHGAELDPAIGEHLADLYPDDVAVGYEAGQVRGAFTVAKPLAD